MSLNIIFMGTPDFAVPILKTINNSKHKILSVYTQPPKKRDRGQKINISPVHKYSNTIQTNVEYPENLDSDEEINKIISLKPDVVVVVAYGKILPVKLIDFSDIKFINIHASLLPRWRGAAPIQRAIMNLDKETGVSIMRIVSKLDSGPVLMKEKIDISQGITFTELSEKMSILGSKMIIKSLDLIEKKKDKFVPQDEKKATYAKKIHKSETKINWNETAEKIVAKINAFQPNPGCWFEINGLRIKPIRVKELKKSGEPGVILSENLTVACAENAVQILELQKEGKQSMKAEEYLRGNKLQVGTNLNSNA